MLSCSNILDFKTRSNPYEGHYPHYNTSVSSTEKSINFNAGDIYITVNQNGARYIMETLEAAATDSFFNWNFFDTILQRKEGYSAYVFEDIAEDYLNNSFTLKLDEERYNYWLSVGAKPSEKVAKLAASK